MEPALALTAIVLAALLVVALVRLRRQAGELAAIRSRLGDGTAARSDVPVLVDRLAERLDAAESRVERLARDRDLLGELIGLGVLRLDDGLRVDLANATAHALLGHPPGRLIGRSVMETFVDTRIEALVIGAREGGGEAGEIRAGDRLERTLAVRVRRSAVRGTWIVLEDVSELRRLQQIRTQFIDNLSHELRTPLTTIGLLAETLARDAAESGLPARLRERIGKIELETGHLTQMVNELLDLSRIEGGGGLGFSEDVDLGQLAVASIERLRLFAERQGVTFQVATPPDLPRIRGNADRLEQVVANLVHNAVKFSPDGGEVSIEVGEVQGEVVCSVVDHGIGIAREDRTRIFERFYKVDGARVRGGGTGLGLAIARHVVEQHDGRIWVESEEGRGSTFSFAIPVASGGSTTSPPAGG